MDASVVAIGSADQTNFRDSAALSSGRGAITSAPQVGPARDDVQLHGRYADALAGQDVRAAQSLGVRDADRRLELVGFALEQAEAGLQGIVKHYPPYAKDHPERIDLLNQISGLRKQIEALTIPSQKNSGGNGPVLVGLPGFDKLDPVGATDAEVATALDQVRRARSGLPGQHAGLWADIVGGAGGQSEREAVMSARQGMAHLAQSAKSITLSQDVIASLG